MSQSDSKEFMFRLDECLMKDAIEIQSLDLDSNENINK